MTKNGAGSAGMARWQGRIEASLKAIERGTEERDKRYQERATAQNAFMAMQMAAQKEAVSAALAASDKAVDKAEATAEKWRASANEWRGAMSDRDRELPSRKEVDGLVAALSARVARLESGAENAAGKSAGVGLTTGILVAVMASAVGVIVAFVAVANLIV